MPRTLVAAILLYGSVAGQALADPAKPPVDGKPTGVTIGPTTEDAALQATTAKFNAYVAFMNRTLRAVDPLDRYKSWVNMKTGPTKRERYIYRLYAVYDVKDERAEAEAALTAAPLLPDLASFSDDFLGQLRGVQDRLARSHGNLRRSVGPEMTLILADYNSMVTMSEISMEVDGK